MGCRGCTTWDYRPWKESQGIWLKLLPFSSSHSHTLAIRRLSRRTYIHALLVGGLLGFSLVVYILWLVAAHIPYTKLCFTIRLAFDCSSIVRRFDLWYDRAAALRPKQTVREAATICPAPHKWWLWAVAYKLSAPR